MPQIPVFTELDEVNITGNRFKEIPATFGSCTSLTVFEAAKNQLTQVTMMVCKRLRAVSCMLAEGKCVRAVSSIVADGWQMMGGVGEVVFVRR
eukprot:1107176-Rhodomonas_salina.7